LEVKGGFQAFVRQEVRGIAGFVGLLPHLCLRNLHGFSRDLLKWKPENGLEEVRRLGN